MSDPLSILVISSILIILAIITAVSFKTGVSFSMQSLARKGQAKFEMDKSKVGRFVSYTIGAFVLNVIYGIIVFQGISELEAVLIISLFNTLFIAWGLLYLVLLKAKKQKNRNL